MKYVAAVDLVYIDEATDAGKVTIIEGTKITQMIDDAMTDDEHEHARRMRKAAMRRDHKTRLVFFRCPQTDRLRSATIGKHLRPA